MAPPEILPRAEALFEVFEDGRDAFAGPFFLISFLFVCIRELKLCLNDVQTDGSVARWSAERIAGWIDEWNRYVAGRLDGWMDGWMAYSWTDR